MSIIRNAKDFFGLTPVDMEHEDAYYEDDRQYRSSGSAAYAPAPAAAPTRDWETVRAFAHAVARELAAGAVALARVPGRGVHLRLAARLTLLLLRWALLRPLAVGHRFLLGRSWV